MTGFLHILFMSLVWLMACHLSPADVQKKKAGRSDAAWPQKAEILDLGSRRELFVDDYLIEQQVNASLVLHAPRDAGNVFRFDKPWEGAFCGYVTVIRNDSLYQLYYRGLPEAGKDGGPEEVTCYAESKDGIHWTRPDLEIYEVHGTLVNNVILAGAAPVTHNFCPFLDTRPGVKPHQRYKALGGTRRSGLIAYVSEDGILWERLQEAPVITEGAFDSQNVSFWSAHEQQYLCYFRTWKDIDGKRYRSVSRTRSEDFIHWTTPEEMSFGNTPWEHLYTNQTSPYFRAPHIYIAIAARFMPSRQVITEEEALQLNVNPKYYGDCSDAVLMTSRGGNHYDRTFMEGFIRPGIGLENWVSRTNYPALNVVQTGTEEMSIYVNQDYAQPTAHLRRYSLRLDGFSSLQAGYMEGEVITRPLRFEGDTLWLNFATSAAGFIKVEMLDAKGDPVEGFEIEKSAEVIGNEIKKAVSWAGTPDLGRLVGRTIKLRFVMKDADLYSIRFQ